MKIHEYQAKQLLSRYGIPVPLGDIARTPEEAAASIAGRLPAPLHAGKAQVHARGRGKGGRARPVRSPEEARGAAHCILPPPLVTPQTGFQDRRVRQVLVAAGVEVAREIYLGITVDRSARPPVLMACPEGGMEIRAVAERFPEKVIREGIPLGFGLSAHQARRAAVQLKLPHALLPAMTQILSSLAKAFVELGCLLVELNPLARTKGGEWVAPDAKMSFDGNALFHPPRHPGASRPRGGEPPGGRGPCLARGGRDGRGQPGVDRGDGEERDARERNVRPRHED